MHTKLRRDFQEQKAVEEKNYKESIYKRNKDSFRMSDKLLNMYQQEEQLRKLKK